MQVSAHSSYKRYFLVVTVTPSLFQVPLVLLHVAQRSTNYAKAYSLRDTQCTFDRYWYKLILFHLQRAIVRCVGQSTADLYLKYMFESREYNEK